MQALKIHFGACQIRHNRPFESAALKMQRRALMCISTGGWTILQGTATISVRKAFAHVYIIDLADELTSSVQDGLLSASEQASSDGARVLVINFCHLSLKKHVLYEAEAFGGYSGEICRKACSDGICAFCRRRRFLGAFLFRLRTFAPRGSRNSSEPPVSDGRLRRGRQSFPTDSKNGGAGT